MERIVRLPWGANAALLIFLCCGFVGPASAKVVYVNKNAGGAVHDGKTWSTAFTAIQPAATAADNGDELWVAASMPTTPAYFETVLIKYGVSMYGGFSGAETARDQRDWHAHVTVLDGNYQGTVVSFQSWGTIIDGFTIRNGSLGGISASGSFNTISNDIISGNSSQAGGIGAGITVFGTAELKDNFISGNSSSAVDSVGAGGIYVKAYSTVTIVNNEIAGNSAYYGGGGISSYGTVDITGNTISGNQTQTYSGAGGVYVPAGKAKITRNTICGNSGLSGGGVNSEHPIAVSITDNAICGNSATYDGGLVTLDVSIINNNTITDNIATSLGGGIGVYGNATISGNIIARNVATYGGGVNVSGGDATLINNVIVGNTAQRASGIEVYSAKATLSNNTICGNSAPNGEGAVIVWSQSSATISNSIIAYNSSGVYFEPDPYATLSLSHNNVFGNSAYNIVGLTSPIGANGNISRDPLFVNRAAGDFHLRLRSPCIDAGDDGVVTPGETDLDGSPRIKRAHVDMGCYEFPAAAKYPPVEYPGGIG